jgi:hypothetical protein
VGTVDLHVPGSTTEPIEVRDADAAVSMRYLAPAPARSSTARRSPRAAMQIKAFPY